MILQFGAGNFLRAFVDLFATESVGIPGPVVVVQSTGKERAEALNAAGGRYHVAIQGYRNGEIVDELVKVESISRALHAGSQWDEICLAGRAPDLSAIVSNTTEAGLALDSRDLEPREPFGSPPFSFPAKLLEVLRARFEAGLPGIPVMPCELVENNGERLRDLVQEQAVAWSAAEEFLDWLRNDCRWINSLVDRIVPGRPADHPGLESDPLLISAEPYAFWGVELSETEPFPFVHPAIVRTPDLQPFTLRKVRILNGAHSALVARSRDFGIETVREAVEDPELGSWLKRLLFEEIVPVIEGRCEDPEGFAHETLDRFRNPFLEHQLSAIALNHEAKVAVRLEPTREEFRSRFGKEPPLLTSILRS